MAGTPKPAASCGVVTPQPHPVSQAATRGGRHLQNGRTHLDYGTYDPDLDLVYWGTGNGGPARIPQDNLYVASVPAIRPKTGEIAWYYQFTPNSMLDHDGVNENAV